MSEQVVSPASAFDWMRCVVRIGHLGFKIRLADQNKAVAIRLLDNQVRANMMGSWVGKGCPGNLVGSQPYPDVSWNPSNEMENHYREKVAAYEREGRSYKAELAGIMARPDIVEILAWGDAWFDEFVWPYPTAGGCLEYYGM